MVNDVYPLMINANGGMGGLSDAPSNMCREFFACHA